MHRCRWLCPIAHRSTAAEIEPVRSISSRSRSLKGMAILHLHVMQEATPVDRGRPRRGRGRVVEARLRGCQHRRLHRRRDDLPLVGHASGAMHVSRSSLARHGALAPCDRRWPPLALRRRSRSAARALFATSGSSRCSARRKAASASVSAPRSSSRTPRLQAAAASPRSSARLKRRLGVGQGPLLREQKTEVERTVGIAALIRPAIRRLGLG